MFKISFLSAILAATSVLASTPRGEDYLYQSDGTGVAYHNGDFVDYELSFEANCFDDRTVASNEVVNNVARFAEWVDLAKAKTSGETIIYTVDPINVSKNRWDTDTICHGKYYAKQNVKLVLKKGNEASALSDDLVQGFYQDLQQAIWPLHTEGNDESGWNIATTINNVVKGVYETTADAMRRLAKGNARNKATADFIDFLGTTFQGTWRLQRVDFTQKNYNGVYTSSVEKVVPELAAPGEFIPATLKLEPLSLSVSGNFYFVYNQ